MVDIAEFLTARYDEREQLARDAEAEQHPSGFPMGTAVEYGLEGIGVGEKFRLFATMWEPKDVLADIAAKRAVLAYLQRVTEVMLDANLWTLDDPRTTAMRQLAAPYVDHPDFKPEWRIDG